MTEQRDETPQFVGESSNYRPTNPDAKQADRARLLIAAASVAGPSELRFALLVAALHLARSIPEHWYTVADQVPGELGVRGSEAAQLTKRLRTEIEQVFSKTTHFDLVTALRGWDYHWEALADPTENPSELVEGRGSPAIPAVGQPGSSVGMGSDNTLNATGDGRRLGRTNFYQTQGRGFVDPATKVSVSLDLALIEFLDDLPSRLDAIAAIPELKQYLEAIANRPKRSAL